MQQITPLLEGLSTGILTVTNLSLIIHELMLAVQRTDPFGLLYPSSEYRVKIVTDCLQILSCKTPQPLRSVLHSMIQHSVPSMVEAIHSAYCDGRQTMLDFYNGEKFLYARARHMPELSPMGRKYALQTGAVDARDQLLRIDSFAETPATADLRTSGFLPEVLDQGKAGTCAAHASANALHFCLKKQGVTPDWSPCRLYLYFTARVYVEHARAADDTGCSIRDVCKAIRNFHVCDEKFMPYRDSDIAVKPSALAVANANLHGQIKYSAVQQTLHALKATLASGYPIICGIQVFQSLEQESVMSTGLVPLPDTDKEQLLGGHAVLLVGYNDDTEQFTFMNSWSAAVGQEGFFSIPYMYITNPAWTADFWVIQFFQ